MRIFTEGGVKMYLIFVIVGLIFYAYLVKSIFKLGVSGSTQLE